MVDRSRIWRGPWRAPGRLVVPPSHGTPTMPISTSAGSRNSGRRMKVATSPKRGVTVPETGWGKFWTSFISVIPSEAKDRVCHREISPLRLAALDFGRDDGTAI